MDNYFLLPELYNRIVSCLICVHLIEARISTFILFFFRFLYLDWCHVTHTHTHIRIWWEKETQQLIKLIKNNCFSNWIFFVFVSVTLAATASSTVAVWYFRNKFHVREILVIRSNALGGFDWLRRHFVETEIIMKSNRMVWVWVHVFPVVEYVQIPPPPAIIVLWSRCIWGVITNEMMKEIAVKRNYIDKWRMKMFVNVFQSDPIIGRCTELDTHLEWCTTQIQSTQSSGVANIVVNSIDVTWDAAMTRGTMLCNVRT